MKLLFDFFPLLVFFGVFKFYDIYWATGAAIAATCVQVAVSWARERRFETVHLVTLAVITVFGGLTVLLRDDLFIKWKPTVVNWLFALVIAAMPAFSKKSALEHVMGGQVALPRPVWRRLNQAWVAFFIILGALNLYVAFYFNPRADEAARTDFWVSFKVFGMLGLTLVFVVAQTLFISRHIIEDTPAEDRPPGGKLTMYYSIYARDAADSLEARRAARPAHLERLNALVDEGRLLAAGPHPAIDSEDPGPAGFSGSLIIAGFDSLEAARAWADADPYVAAGVYESVEVKPFRKVLP